MITQTIMRSHDIAHHREHEGMRSSSSRTTWDMARGDPEGLPAVSACMGVTCARTL